MTIFQSLTLAVVQGITEFLPVSSSGHLNLFQHFFGLTPSLNFDIFLNTATLFSVLFFFRKQIKYFFANLGPVIVGSVPAGLIGILFKDRVDTLFGDVRLLPWFFLLTSVYLLALKFIPSQNKKPSYLKAFIIGIFQGIAILPAVSRSGSTIFAGLLLGLSPLEAFNFSFSLFIPASLGALLLDARHLSTAGLLSGPNLLAFITTFAVGIVALYLLQKILSSRKLWYFGVYTLLLSIALFFVL